MCFVKVNFTDGKHVILDWHMKSGKQMNVKKKQWNF